MAELDRPPAAGRDWNIFAVGCLYIPIQFQESAPPDPDASQIRNRADTLFMCFALESRASRPTCRARPQRPPAGRDRLDPVRTCEGCVRSDSSGQAANSGAGFGDRTCCRWIRIYAGNRQRGRAAGKVVDKDKPGPRRVGDIVIVPVDMPSAVHRPLRIGTSAQHAFNGGKHGPRGAATWGWGVRNDTPDDWGLIEVHDVAPMLGPPLGPARLERGDNAPARLGSGRPEFRDDCTKIRKMQTGRCPWRHLAYLTVKGET